MGHVMKILQAAGYVVLEFPVVVDLWLMAQHFLLHETMSSSLGYIPAYVLSGSMGPTFPAGDMILITEEPEYQVDDVMAYQMGSQTVTHRTVGEEDGQSLLQGDANNTPDIDLAKKEQILGKQVAVIPYLGWLISFLRTPVGLVALVLVGVALVELPYWIGDKERDS